VAPALGDDVGPEVDGVFVGGRRGDDDADLQELLHVEEIRRPQMLITSADSGVQ
jgi:hypothetical protein